MIAVRLRYVKESWWAWSVYYRKVDVNWHRMDDGE